MQNLEASYDEGEYAVKRFKALQAANLPLPGTNQEVEETEEHESEEGQASTSSSADLDQKQQGDHFNIFEELLKLSKQKHPEEDEVVENSEEDDSSDSESNAEIEDVKHVCEPFILDKLVNEQKLNTIIFNLYSGNKGYSIALRTQDRAMCIKAGIQEEIIETKTWQYEEREILRYLDREEIPAFLMETLDQYGFFFYNGCVIAEVRDYRQNYPLNKYNVHHILLQPKQQNIFTDIYNYTKDVTDLTTDEKNDIESQITMLHTPDLYVEPDLNIENKLARIRNRKHFWNSHRFRKIAEKFSQNAVNRKRKLDQHAERYSSDFIEFAKAKKRRHDTQLPCTSTRSILYRKISLPEENKTVLPIPNLDCHSITGPEMSIGIIKFNTSNWPESTVDCSPQLIEEYILESDTKSTDTENPGVYHIRLSIYQIPSNLECVGELYLDRDHKKGEDNGVSCRFALGSQVNSRRYVEQFTEIFTESGRKSARIKRGRLDASRSLLHPSIASKSSSTSNASITAPQVREQLEKLTQVLHAQNQHSQPSTYVNGIRQHAIPTVQMLHHVQTNSTQKTQQQKTNSELLGISAISAHIRDYAEQFEANVKQQAAQKQQQQQQKLSANSTIINSLNSSPICSLNSEAAAVVVNTLNGTSAVHQRILSGKITSGPSNITGRINPKLLKAVSPRILNSTGDNKSLSALLVGTPAADRPDIIGPNTNSLLLEKLAGSPAVQNTFNTHSTATKVSATPQTQFVVQSPKGNFVISPQQSSNSLNLAQFQSLHALQNVKVQLSNSTQRISLNMLNVSGQVSAGSGGPAGLLVSLPTGAGGGTTTTAQNPGGIITGQATQQSQTVQGVVLNAAGNTPQLAQLTNAGNIRSIAHQNLRLSSGSQTVQLRQHGNGQFQVFPQLQRQARQQQNIIPLPISSTSRATTTTTIQRTPITTIKMTPNSSQLKDIHLKFNH